MKGYVYIISNPAMPGIFKIGFTLNDPELRAKQLNSTGTPHPFVVDYEILVDEPHDLEQRVHKILQEFNENKEWFRCSFSQAVQVIHACYQGRIYYEGCLKAEREAELEQARQEKLHEEQQRREAEQKEKEEEAQRIEQERLRQEEVRKQAEEQKMWSYELGFSDDSPKRQPRTKAEYEEEMERAWREAEESRRRERIRQEQEFERIKVEQLEQAFEEKKRLSEEKFAEEYRKTQPKQIIITCPNCGKKQCVENSPHIKAHCPLCLHNFKINFYKQIFDDGQFVYAWPEKENRRYGEKKFSKKDYEDDLERAWLEEELRRQWERTTKKSYQGSKTFIGTTKRDLELEWAWRKEEERRRREREARKIRQDYKVGLGDTKRGLELERTRREEDVRGQQKQEAKDVRQGVKVVLGGTKRDLELERAWREEEERRRREREARKLQQGGKVIIACIECGQKLRVSNAPYLHVRCPKCSCRFYWENK